MSEKRANKVLGIVISSIVIVALIVVFSIKEPTAKLEKGSPEAAVQQYLNAIADRDFNHALTLLTTDSKCTLQDFNRAYIQDSLRISLSDVTSTATTDNVKVKIETSNGDPFGSTYAETQNLDLSKTDSDWKITGIPWPMYECGGVYK